MYFARYGSAAAPRATVGVDVDGDGRADYLVSGVDRDRDGIPDALQGPPTPYRSALASEAYVYPNYSQSGYYYPHPMGYLAPPGYNHPGFYPPRATVGVDVDGDGRADYLVSGVDRDRDGIPDALQRPRSLSATRAFPASPPGFVPPTASHHAPYPLGTASAYRASKGYGYPPRATVGVDVDGDGRADYLVSGVDRDRDGIPDALQRPRSLSATRAFPASPPGFVPPTASHHAPYPLGTASAYRASKGYGYPPRATVGVDVDGDGRADYLVSGVDRDRDGIPDALQGPAYPHYGRSAASAEFKALQQKYPGYGYPPRATVGVDVDGDGRADYLVSGVDRDRDGIPDALQGGSSYRSYGYRNAAAEFDALQRRYPGPYSAAPPRATVGVDVDGDGRADYLVSGVDRDRDGIPDALQGRN
eukprot:TRINITY_DN4343_c0_g1_i11.p1 TRINITY_DN4343_c0_g1~~TRINITY_DN4343_c0_g1_i11.p1  ORF type:complete len:418 (+),score=60.62 TRINITY_DN4343_c0_g1_i11:243-1496(+)